MSENVFPQSVQHLVAEPSREYHLLEALLQRADIRINGDRPWDMRLHAAGVPERILAQGNLGLGETYMEGGWDAERLDEFFYRLLRARVDEQVQPLQMVFHALRTRVFNLQTMRRAWRVGRVHYDLGNDFYAAMLDPRMVYSCGYWKSADDLAAAQEAKLELICRKIGLQRGMRVLDIGCGWGSFMGFAAERYGVECVGVTVSRAQLEWAQRRYAHLPLEFRLQDYRELDEVFDRIVSVGMFEHVGHRNYRSYMQVAHRCLANDGLFLLHTIGKNNRQTGVDAWFDKYIFPNGELPSIDLIGDAVDGLFVVEDLHNFGADYDRTLMAWHANFEAAWSQFSSALGETFYRMWRYYLLSCAGAFRARGIHVWQWVLTKNGIVGGYPRVG
jgi:cyclopropane-fatty-acyl-phospholipid synthase